MNGIADLYKLADVQAGKPSPMMVFPVGDWTSAKYPRLTLSQELANEVIANFEAEVLRTRVPVDLNHDPKSPANGWVDRLYMAPFEWNGVSGEALFADWTPNERGAQVVNDGEYAYDSLEIATHEDPVSGTSYDNVLKAISLTNRPVLRMMPGVLEAGDALKLAEPLELQLSEVTAADDDPMASLLADLEAVLNKASTTLKGKPGIPAIRTYLRETLTKASAHKLAEDGSTNDQREALCEALKATFGAMHQETWVEDFGPDWVVYNVWPMSGDGCSYYRADYAQSETGITFGQPVEVERETNFVPVPDSSPTGAQPASSVTVALGKAAEGHGAHLAEGDAAEKGVEHHMDPKTLSTLKLAEGADDAAIDAAVLELAEERDTAVTKLAEQEKQATLDAVIVKLDEKIAGAFIAPGERDAYLKLAETDAAQATAMIEARQAKVIDLGEAGTGEHGETSEDVTVELDERAKKIATERGIDYGQATSLALSEDPAFADRYNAREL